MVGVPGGSKGCSTCRKRKIKCDLQEPYCGQCISSRRQCTGPVKGLIMRLIHPTHRVKDTRSLESSHAVPDHDHKFVMVAENAIEKRNGRRIMQAPISPPETDSGTSDDGSIVENRPVAVQRLPRYRSGGHGNVQQISQDSMYLQLLVSDFVERFSSTKLDAATGIMFDPWIRNLPKFVLSPNAALSYAAKAVIIGQWSRVKSIRYLTQVSSNLFVNALRHQSFEIARSIRKNFIEDHVLSSGLLLSLYEVFCFTSINSWKQLSHGAAKMFEARGPYAFRSGPSAELFHSVRMLLATFALTSTQSTFLARPEWISVPFEDLPEKPMHQRLIDILLLISKYKVVVTRLLSNADCEFDALRIYSDLTDVIFQLESWFAIFEQHALNTTSKTVSDNVLYVEDNFDCPVVWKDECLSQHLFRPSLRFKSSESAILLPVFWAGMAVSYNLRARIHAYNYNMRAPDTIQGNDAALSQHSQLTQDRVRDLCTLICKSLKPSIEAELSLNSIAILYPLKVVQTFAGDSLQSQWIQYWANRLDELHGISISSNTHIMQNYKVLHVDKTPSVCLCCGEIILEDWSQANTEFIISADVAKFWSFGSQCSESICTHYSHPVNRYEESIQSNTTMVCGRKDNGIQFEARIN
ncbi:hypothetical protein V1512DRAFT_212867 [Lipomyces arxii]|uniref:uncharacterized protein n=1 Tax=Lipomyces arxii TaxID=56418 RepID=UPI0034CF9032